MANPFLITANLRVMAGPSVQQVRQEVQSALRNLKAEINLRLSAQSLRQINTLNARLRTLTTNLELVTKGALSAEQALTRFTQAAGGVSNVAGRLNAVSKSVDRVAHSFQTSGSFAEEFGKKTKFALVRFASFALPVTTIFGIGSAFVGATRDAIDFQNQMVRLAQITNRSQAGIRDTGDEIIRLSTKFGVSSAKLSEVAVTLAQAGLSALETKTALEALAKTDVSPTFLSLENTTEAAIALMNQFDVSVNDLGKRLGQISAVSAAYAVESEDLSTAIRKAGGAFKAAGGNFEEFLALFTSVRETTREDADAIATGLRTIFGRLQRPELIKFFQDLGVELTNVKGELVGPFQEIQRISDALNHLKDAPTPARAKIIEELGGLRQLSRVIPLIQQSQKQLEILNLAKRSTNQLDQEAVAGQQSLIRQLTSLREEFGALFKTIASDQTFQRMITGMLDLAKAAIKLTDALSPVLPVLAAFTAARVIKAAPAFLKGFTHRASGGIIPGSGNTDSVPALLTPGEFVIRKSAVQRIGADNLDKLNKFSRGGRVHDRHGRFISPSTLEASTIDTSSIGTTQTSGRPTNARGQYISNQEIQRIAEITAPTQIFIGGSVDTSNYTTAQVSRPPQPQPRNARGQYAEIPRPIISQPSYTSSHVTSVVGGEELPPLPRRPTTVVSSQSIQPYPPNYVRPIENALEGFTHTVVAEISDGMESVTHEVSSGIRSVATRSGKTAYKIGNQFVSGSAYFQTETAVASTANSGRNRRGHFLSNAQLAAIDQSSSQQTIGGGQPIDTYFGPGGNIVGRNPETGRIVSPSVIALGGNTGAGVPFTTSISTDFSRIPGRGGYPNFTMVHNPQGDWDREQWLNSNFGVYQPRQKLLPAPEKSNAQMRLERRQADSATRFNAGLQREQEKRSLISVMMGSVVRNAEVDEAARMTFDPRVNQEGYFNKPSAYDRSLRRQQERRAKINASGPIRRYNEFAEAHPGFGTQLIPGYLQGQRWRQDGRYEQNDIFARELDRRTAAQAVVAEATNDISLQGPRNLAHGVSLNSLNVVVGNRTNNRLGEHQQAEHLQNIATSNRLHGNDYATDPLVQAGREIERDIPGVRETRIRGERLRENVRAHRGLAEGVRNDDLEQRFKNVADRLGRARGDRAISDGVKSPQFNNTNNLTDLDRELTVVPGPFNERRPLNEQALLNPELSVRDRAKIVNQRSSMPNQLLVTALTRTVRDANANFDAKYNDRLPEYRGKDLTANNLALSAVKTQLREQKSPDTTVARQAQRARDLDVGAAQTASLSNRELGLMKQASMTPEEKERARQRRRMEDSKQRFEKKQQKELRQRRLDTRDYAVAANQGLQTPLVQDVAEQKRIAQQTKKAIQTNMNRGVVTQRQISMEQLGGTYRSDYFTRGPGNPNRPNGPSGPGGGGPPNGPNGTYIPMGAGSGPPNNPPNGPLNMSRRARFGRYVGKTRIGGGLNALGNKITPIGMLAAATAAPMVINALPISERNKRGAGGAVTGALGGAALGSAILPGIGTAVGALAGGLLGAVSSIKEFDNELRDQEINKSLSELNEAIQSGASAVKVNDAFSKVRTNIGSVEGLSVLGQAADLSGNLSIYSKTFANKGNRSLGDSFAYESSNAMYNKLQQQEIDKQRELAPAQAQAEGVLRDYFNKGGTIEGARKLYGSTLDVAGTKEGLFDNASGTRGAGIKVAFSVLEEVKARQSMIKIMTDYSVALNTDADALEQMGRTIDDTLAELNRFSEQSKKTTNLFSGQLSGGVTTPVSQVRFGERSDIFDEKLSKLTSGFGGGGAALYRQASSANTLQENLPMALRNAYAERSSKYAAGEGVEGFDFASSVMKFLPKELDSTQKDVLQTKLSQMSEGEIDTTISDPYAAAERLAGDFAKNSEGYINKLQDAIKNFAEFASSEFVQNQQLIQQVGQERDKLSSMQLDQFRLAGEQAAEYTGNTSLALIHPDTATQAFRDTQTRLSGGGYLNPTQLGGRIQMLTAARDEASRLQQSALDNFDQAGYAAATANFTSLDRQLNDSVQALRNFAQATEESAGVQQLLNRINADSAQRRSIAEGFFGSDLQGRREMLKDIANAKLAASEGFDTLSIQQQQSAIRGSRTAGGLIVDEESGATLSDKINEQLGNAMGGVFAQGGGLQDIASQLHERQNAALELAADAQKQLVDYLASQQEQFATQLAGTLQGALTSFSTGMDSALSNMGAKELAQSLNQFANSSAPLVDAMRSFPRTIALGGNHQVNVVMNGQEAMARIMPDLQKLIQSEIQRGIEQLIKERFPDSGPSIYGHPYNSG